VTYLIKSKTKKKYESFCLAQYESNDTSDTAQLQIVIRDVRESFEVVEEVANFKSLHDITSEEDVLCECQTTKKFKLFWTKIQ